MHIPALRERLGIKIHIPALALWERVADEGGRVRGAMTRGEVFE